MAVLTSFGQLLLLLLPACLSAAAAARNCLWLLLPAALLLVILVRVLPLCRGDAVIWTLLLTAPTGLPANLLLTRFLWEALWRELPLWAAVPRCLLVLYVLFSIETLALSLLACLFRKSSALKRRTPHEPSRR